MVRNDGQLEGKLQQWNGRERHCTVIAAGSTRKVTAQHSRWKCVRKLPELASSSSSMQLRCT
jgi:hypothetical protein